MKRRQASNGSVTPPPELLVFDGRPYRTEAAWQAAFDQWMAARRDWAQARGLSEDDDIFDGLGPPEVDGDCPWDGTGY